MAQNSFAYELIQDYKKQNKRQFIIILVILSMWFLTTGYLVYLLNNIEGMETTESYDMTQDIDDIDTINGDIINRGK